MPDLNFSPKELYIGGSTFETINPSNLGKLGDVSRYRGPDTGKPKNRPTGWLRKKLCFVDGDMGAKPPQTWGLSGKCWLSEPRKGSIRIEQ